MSERVAACHETRPHKDMDFVCNYKASYDGLQVGGLPQHIKTRGSAACVLLLTQCDTVSLVAYVHIDISFALQIHPFLSSYTTVVVIPQSRTWFCFVSCVLSVFLVVWPRLVSNNLPIDLANKALSPAWQRWHERPHFEPQQV